MTGEPLKLEGLTVFLGEWEGNLPVQKIAAARKYQPDDINPLLAFVMSLLDDGIESILYLLGDFVLAVLDLVQWEVAGLDGEPGAGGSSQAGPAGSQERGGVAALEGDESGALRLINRVASHGNSPCHVALHPSGRYLLVANYASGSVAVFPVRADGGLGDASHVERLTGSSVDPERQQSPHPHSVNLDPTGRYLFVPDLGTDRIMIHKFSAEDGTLVPAEHAWVAVHPGSGPRHFAFHPSSRYAYLITEMGSTVVAYSWDGADGLTELQRISTLPPGWEGENYCADIHVHPSGRFLYGSNRGHDSIVVYEIQQHSGLLRLSGHHSSGGRWPRNFALDPVGRRLLAANRDTGDVVVFDLDEETGVLAATGYRMEIAGAVCVRWWGVCTDRP